MKPAPIRRLFLSALVALAATFVCWITVPPSAGALAARASDPIDQAKSATANPDAPVIADFQKRVKEYVALHKKFEAMLTKLPDKATPQQIDKNQRALAALIENGRRTAKRGDIFGPAMEALVRRELLRIFGTPEGKQLRASIMDENPLTKPLRVNGRYPDTVALSTMPPEVLGVLPPLDEEMEYRFVADQLILLDGHAHIVADYVEHALPGGAGR
jgi:hypothetical protein